MFLTPHILRFCGSTWYRDQYLSPKVLCPDVDCKSLILSYLYSLSFPRFLCLLTFFYLPWRVKIFQEWMLGSLLGRISLSLQNISKIWPLLISPPTTMISHLNYYSRLLTGFHLSARITNSSLLNTVARVIVLSCLSVLKNMLVFILI